MEPVGYLILSPIFLLLGKLIYNWWHEVGKRNRYMEVQIKLLAEIAKHSGVSEQKVGEILGGAKMK